MKDIQIELMEFLIEAIRALRDGNINRVETMIGACERMIETIKEIEAKK